MRKTFPLKRRSNAKREETKQAEAGISAAQDAFEKFLAKADPESVRQASGTRAKGRLPKG